MNVFSPAAFPPHLHASSRLSPTLSVSIHSGSMSVRKRKADDDGYDFHNPERADAREAVTSGDGEDRMRMSASPANSPIMAPRPLQRPRNKRLRPSVTGRALPLPRLLETLNTEALRTVLQRICDSHPNIGAEVIETAPRPSVTCALDVLHKYESSLRAAFPFGGCSTSNYAYDRVHQALVTLLDALEDFTPHFLPPNESQTSTSLNFLDAATDMIYRLTKWDNPQHNHHRNAAYEEMSKAWALVIREAAKRGAGIQLQYGGWDQKLAKHNELAEGKMQGAIQELRTRLGWMGGEISSSSGAGGESENLGSIRQQLMSGTYGSGLQT